jgi:hypothetical protein
MYLSLKVNFYANSTPLFTSTIVVSSLRKKNPCLRQEKQFINDNVNLNDNNNFSAEVFPPKAGFFRDNSINLT